MKNVARTEAVGYSQTLAHTEPQAAGITMTSHFRIRSADANDAEAVHRLAESLSHDRVSSDPGEGGGFLVSAYSQRRYEEFAADVDHFYLAVARGTEQLIGFVLAYSSEHAPANDWLTSFLLVVHRGPFLMIKQVAVSQAVRRRGIAKALYDYVLGQVEGRPVFAAIVLDPPNEASNRLHLQMGFEPLFDATPPDGIPRRVWRTAVIDDDDRLRVVLVRAK